MTRHLSLVLALAVLVTACGVPGDPLSSETTMVDDTGATSTTLRETTSTTPDENGASSFPMCGETPYPSAPEDWYRHTPIYVGNEMPVEEVRAFASQLDGYENIWIDRDHNGWVTVGFHGIDVEQHQRALEAEFPQAGVVAVEMPHALEDLERMRGQIHEQLPDDMHALNLYEVPGEIEVWVGMLTPERIELVESVAGQAPVCLSGIDPETAPSQEPQAGSGDDWVFVAVVDSILTESPDVITTVEKLDEFASDLGVTDDLLAIDFDTHIVVALPAFYSGSCPDTRFDGFEITDDLVKPVIAHTSLAEACTSDANPRTYLIGLERSALPAPPFRIWEGNSWPPGILVRADLRIPSSTLEPGDVETVEFEQPRSATEMPFVMETGYPWTITVDPDCGLDYLGSINSVGWYRGGGASSIPAEWKAEIVDGLLDLEVLLTEGPEPSLTASAGGLDVVYLPGPDEGGPCG